MVNKIIFRMSEAGKCPRALAAQYLKYPGEEKPLWLETAASEGNWHEKRIKESLWTEDLAVTNEQDEVGLNGFKNDFRLIGHIDGIVHMGDKREIT